MKSTRKMCLSTEERRTSGPKTWTGSIRHCTRYWPSRHPIRLWHPSSHLKKLKTRESLCGNAGNVKREEITDIEWRFSLNGDASRKSLKVTDLPQAFYRSESSLKEFQRGRPAELDDDVRPSP